MLNFCGRRVLVRRGREGRDGLAGRNGLDGSLGRAGIIKRIDLRVNKSVHKGKNERERETSDDSCRMIFGFERVVFKRSKLF